MIMIRLTNSATSSAARGFLANSLSLIAKLTKTVKKKKNGIVGSHFSHPHAVMKKVSYD